MEEEKFEITSDRLVSQSICERPEDMQYLIRDTESGMNYDVRQNQSVLLLNQEDDKLTKLQLSGKPWKDWWKEKRKHNYELFTAAEKGDKNSVLDLIDQSKHGDLVADINAKGLDDFTSLHFAANEGKYEIVELLIRNGANIDAQSSSLRTPLHVSCSRGFKNVVEFLVNVGADINAQDKDGNTPAHILSEGGRLEILEWFLKKKPNLVLKNIYGETAVEVAAKLEVRQLLLQNSQEIAGQDTYSRTVVKNAIFHNNRADFVKSTMFRAQMIEESKQKQQVEKTKNIETNSPKTQDKFKSRRCKIIEAAKMISTLNPEEIKASFKTPEKKQKPKEEEIPVTPDDFDIIQLLGKGSFGEVYLATYKKTGAHYAMKVMSKKRIMGQNLTKYVKAERNVMCNTKHPFIVGLEFAFQTADKLFLILQYCPG